MFNFLDVDLEDVIDYLLSIIGIMAFMVLITYATMAVTYPGLQSSQSKTVTTLQYPKEHVMKVSDILLSLSTSQNIDRKVTYVKIAGYTDDIDVPVITLTPNWVAESSKYTPDLYESLKEYETNPVTVTLQRTEGDVLFLLIYIEEGTT